MLLIEFPGLWNLGNRYQWCWEAWPNIWTVCIFSKSASIKTGGFLGRTSTVRKGVIEQRAHARYERLARYESTLRWQSFSGWHFRWTRYFRSL